jgi:hypothetical protein
VPVYCRHTEHDESVGPLAYVQRVRDIQLVLVWTRFCGGGRRRCSTPPSLATSSSFRGPMYRDLGSLTRAPRIPHESSSTSGLLVWTVVGLVISWQGDGSNTHRASHSATSRLKPSNICWLTTPSPGRFVTRCYHGFDPRHAHHGGETTS